MNDGAKEFDNCAIIKRALVRFAHAFDHFAFARMVAEMHAGSRLRLSNFESDARALVQQAQQLAVERVYLFSPTFNGHRVTPCSEVSTARVSGWVNGSNPRVECLTHPLTRMVLTSDPIQKT